MRIFHRRINLNPDNVTTVVKATVLLHNILTVPADKVHTKVTDNRAKIFDDAFQDLANVGSQHATVAIDVRNYLQSISTVWQVLLSGRMIMPMYIRYAIYLLL